VNLSRCFITVAIDDSNAIAAYFGEISLFEIDESICDRQQCRYAAGDIVLPIPQPDHERARDTADNDAIRIFGIDDKQRKRTLEQLDRLADSLDEIEALFQVVVYQVRCYFGICLGIELVPFGEHFLFDRLEVFDDAVVYDGDTTTREMWVRVGFRYATVCCPASVRHPNPTLKRALA
jgi:hypothetical protein